MKTIKLVSLLTTAFFTFWACERAEEEEEVGPAEELLGTWELNYFSQQRILTANRDAKVFDGDSKGEGAIELSGAHRMPLTYIWYFSRDEYDTSVTVSNRPWAWGTGGYPTYLLYLYHSSECSTFNEFFIEPGGGYKEYNSEEGDFSFENLTLTISEIKLYRCDYKTNTIIDSTDTVIVEGTLTAGTIDIAANTPIVLDEWTDEDPNKTLILKDGDDFVWIFRDEWANTGVWEVEGDTLTLYEDREISSFAYTLDGDHLTLKSEDNFCSWAEDDPDECAWCLEDLEEEHGLYGLEEVSRGSIVDHVTLKLSRSSDRSLAREVQIGDRSDGKSIRRQLFARNRNPGSSRYPHPPR